MLLIIWDFDGTLANSEKKFKCIVDGFLKEKISGYVIDSNKFTEEFYYKNCAGKKYTDTFKVLGEHNIIDYSKITEENLNDFLDYANMSFKTILPGEITLTKNIDWLLDRLDANSNISMLIATSAIKHDFILKCEAVNNAVINKMDGYSCHELADDYVHLNINKYGVKNKPNPAIFIYSLQEQLKSGIKIDDVVIVEDSVSGCMTGRNFTNDDFVKNNVNRVSVVGYTAGEHRPDAKILLESGADIAIGTAEGLYEYILSL